MNILVVRSAGALGDIILTLPALRELRRSFPQAHIELAGDSSFLCLAREWVDSIVSQAEGMWCLFSPDADIPRSLGNYLASFDLVYVFMPGNEGAVERMKGICRDVKAIVPLPPDGIHASDWLVRQTAGSPDGVLARVTLTEECREWAEEFKNTHGLTGMEKVVCYAPGSGSPAKNWSEDNFVGVVEELKEKAGCSVIKILGPAERGEGESFVATDKEDVLEVVNLPVEHLAAVLKVCDLYIGNDSGVTHLAAAVGTSTIALFGPTDPAVWGPKGENVTVIRGERMDSISVRSVLKAAERCLIYSCGIS